eukprot:7029814-Prymnesium_polylepis.5
MTRHKWTKPSLSRGRSATPIARSMPCHSSGGARQSVWTGVSTWAGYGLDEVGRGFDRWVEDLTGVWKESAI